MATVVNSAKEENLVQQKTYLTPTGLLTEGD